MKKLTLLCAIFVTCFGLSGQLFADNHDVSGGSENTTVDTDTLDALILQWLTESDLLTKGELAKEIQKLLKVNIDGLIGKKTIAAIKAVGVMREISKSSREENAKIKLALQVSEGKLTQEQADVIEDQRSAIKDIRDKVKSGELTKEEAKTELNVIKENLPVIPKPPKNEGGNKSKKYRKN